MKQGDIVWDDLTATKTTIIRVATDKQGNIGVWVDNNYLDGARYPWEVTLQTKEEV
jgi:hypothetical protein